MASKCCSRCANTHPLYSFLADPSNPKSKIRLTCVKCRTENSGAKARMKRKALESLDPNVPSKRPVITRTKPTEAPLIPPPPIQSETRLEPSIPYLLAYKPPLRYKPPRHISPLLGEGRCPDILLAYKPPLNTSIKNEAIPITLRLL
jgi:hypothetical protein